MSFISGLEHIVREEESLAPYNWLRLGGVAQYFAEPTNQEELATIVQRAREQELPVKLLGAGSNLIIRDEGVSGVVIRLSAPSFCDIQVNGTQIKAGSGSPLNHLIATSVREGLSGLDQLVGIPGTVGGALHGNAGTINSDIGESVIQATVLTSAGELKVREQDELRFSYRQSSLDELAILDVIFELEEGNSDDLTKHMQKLWIVKKTTHPASNQPSAMIFKDPGGLSASSLIEQAGLKGTSIGGVQIDETNANFITVSADANSQDILRLIELIQNRVEETTGVELEQAINVW